MTVKVLDLDEIDVALGKEFKFKGKTHAMAPMSVGDYVKQVKRAKAMEDAGAKLSDTEAVEFMIGVIRTAFPTLSQEDAEALDMGRLNILFEYVKADAEELTQQGKQPRRSRAKRK